MLNQNSVKVYKRTEIIFSKRFITTRREKFKFFVTQVVENIVQ